MANGMPKRINGAGTKARLYVEDTCGKQGPEDGSEAARGACPGCWPGCVVPGQTRRASLFASAQCGKEGHARSRNAERAATRRARAWKRAAAKSLSRSY